MEKETPHNEMTVPLAIIAHQMPEDQPDWAIDHLWVNVRVEDSGDLEMLPVTGEELEQSEEDYVDLLLEKGRINEQQADEILSR